MSKHDTASAPRTKNKRFDPVRWGGICLVLVAIGLVALKLTIGGSSGSSDGGLFYTIPLGAQNLVPAGQISAVEMPTVIDFPAGSNARITVVNNDTVTHLAGPFFVGPGQTFVQTFPSPGTYPITCTVNEDESIVVTVE